MQKLKDCFEPDKNHRKQLVRSQPPGFTFVYVAKEGPPLEKFDANVIIDMWFPDKVCCLTDGPH